ncbi:cytochrome c oxidase assembly protein [uncultured Nocardioides sp.]|uniref:cytochrome c oxidase assembly protein n=1 Tax=uncultured Nocardioides sp. TaxID=198441 RepID=UPI0026137E0B|nr:cytochrome c oxidase assembly protein [uncultured Nocardioides sp.]
MTSTEPRTGTPEVLDDHGDAGARRTQALAALLASAGALVVLLLVAGGAPSPAPPGLPDPGPVVGWALPALDLVGQLVAVTVVSLLLVPLLTLVTLRDPLSRTPRGGGPVRAVVPLALLWALVSLAQAVTTYADQVAVPLTGLRLAGLLDTAGSSSQVQSLLVQVVLALVVAATARTASTAGGAVVALVLALAAVVPPLLVGHAGSGTGGHGTAEVALLWHVLGASVWAGGVVALWWHLPSRSNVADPSPAADRAAARFSALAAWCFGVVAVSGVVSALTRVTSLSDLATGYGAGVLAKTVVLGSIGLVALRLRRLVRASDRPGRAFAGLAGIEVTLMATAFGLGAALARTPTPPTGVVTRAEALLGGPLPDAVTFGRLLWSWQPSGVGLSVVLLGGVAYAVGVRRLGRRGDRWPVGRTLSFAFGLLLVLWATSGGLGVYAGVLFSAHMVAHMVLSMLAPIFLVLGAPITLALRALPGPDVPGGTGPRQLLSRALRSRVAGVVSHPVVVAGIFVGSLYVVYLGGLFDVLMDHHLGHAAMELHFLLSGLLFFEILIGDSPMRRLPHVARLGLLMVTIAFHAFFAVAVMSSELIIGGDYYEGLGFSRDPAYDQYLGGSATWALGELPMVLLVVVLLFQWFRDDDREAKRRDRSGNAEAELAAYNAMLARAAGRDAASERDRT